MNNPAMNVLFGGFREIMKECGKLKRLMFPDRTRIFGRTVLPAKDSDVRGTFASGERLGLKDVSGRDTGESMPKRLFHTHDLSGEGLLSVEDILRLHDDLISGIRDLIPLTEAEFDERLMPLIKNFTAFAYTLPASEYYHHHEFLGLVTHSLETAFFAVRELFDECFDFGLSGGRRTRRESRVAGCIFAAALLHDAGKPLTDITVHTDGRCLSGKARNRGVSSSRPAGKWNPLDGGLYAYLKEHGCSSYLYEYVPLRGKRHEKLALTAAGLILPKEFTSWIMEEPDLMEELCASVNCDKTSVFYDLVKKSDIMSVRYHLTGIRLSGVKAGDRNGLPPELVPLTDEIIIHNGGNGTTDTDVGRLGKRKKGGSGTSSAGEKPRLHDRFNVFRRMNDNASGIIGLTVELLQQKIADSENPCNFADSCLFFTDRECLLSVNPRNFFDMMSPLKNTGIPGVVSDSMDLYEKLILTGIGEYADGNGTVILGRILVSFDGVNLTEIHGLRIIRPEYLFGGMRPAPLTSYDGDMMRAFDAVKSMKGGVKTTREGDESGDNAKERITVTVAECREYLKEHPVETPETAVSVPSVTNPVELKDTHARENEGITPDSHKNAECSPTDQNDCSPEKSGTEISVHVPKKKELAVPALSLLLEDPVIPVVNPDSGNARIRDFRTPSFDFRTLSWKDSMGAYSHGSQGKSQSRGECSGASLITAGTGHDDGDFYCASSGDWYFNPMRITSDTRLRDAHGRFVKGPKKASGGNDETTAGDTVKATEGGKENSMEVINTHIRKTARQNIKTPDSQSQSPQGDEKDNNAGTDEFISLIRCVSGFDDIRISTALSSFTLNQLNSLAGKIVRRSGRRGSGILKASKNSANTASSEKKLYTRIVPLLQKVSADAVEKHALSGLLMTAEPGVEELTALKAADAVRAMLNMTVIQKTSFLGRIRDKALKQ